MNTKYRNAVLSCIFLVELTGTAWAQSARMVGDTYYAVAGPDLGNNFGSSANVNVGGPYRGLLQFDLSTLPPSAPGQVEKATLTLFANKVAPGGSIQVYEAGGAWTELAVNGNNAPALGQFMGTAAVNIVDDYYTIDVTLAVRSWVGGFTPNYGFAIVPAGVDASLSFDSKESAATSHPATLQVTFVNQGPAGPQGALGPEGPMGDPGPPGPSSKVYRVTTDSYVPEPLSSAAKVVASMTVPAGGYSIVGKATNGRWDLQSGFLDCTLEANGTVLDEYIKNYRPNFGGGDSVLLENALQLTTPTMLTIKCHGDSLGFSSIGHIRLVATQGNVQ